LKKLIRDHDALLIASPEYNNSVTGVLKNTIDWLSRPSGKDDPDDVFTGKVAAIIGASPGRFGASSSANHLRTILRSLDVFVIPAQCSISAAHQAFDDDGTLKDERAQKALQGVVDQLAKTAQALRG
jgi:chromate reductase, NAD(P)H dehydrogenase (quinone)